MQSVSAAQMRAVFEAFGSDAWRVLPERFGRVFRYRGGVVSADPAHVPLLLRDKRHTLQRAQAHRLISHIVPGSRGMLFLDGDPWRDRMRALARAFSPATAADWEASHRDAVQREISEWSSGADLFDAVTRMNVRVMLEVAHNLDPRDARAVALADHLMAYKRLSMRDERHRRLDDFSAGVEKLGSLPSIVGGLLALRREVLTMESVLGKLLAAPPLVDPRRRGWLELLLAAGFDGRELTSEINHLYGAFTAVDYVGTCLLATIAGTTWNEGLDDPNWRAALIREATRCFPVTNVVYRRLGAPTQLGDAQFPAGTTVMLLPYALHHDPEVFADPTRFDPTRWLDERHEGASLVGFAPFLAGPRQCIGQHLARQHLDAMLEALQGIEFTVSAGPRSTEWELPRLASPIGFQVRPASILHRRSVTAS